MPRWVHHDLQGRESTFLSGRGEATDLRPDVPLDNHHLATMMMKLTVMIMLVKISLSSEDQTARSSDAPPDVPVSGMSQSDHHSHHHHHHRHWDLFCLPSSSFASLFSLDILFSSWHIFLSGKDLTFRSSDGPCQHVTQCHSKSPHHSQRTRKMENKPTQCSNI